MERSSESGFVSEGYSGMNDCAEMCGGCRATKWKKEGTGNVWEGSHRLTGALL